MKKYLAAISTLALAAAMTGCSMMGKGSQNTPQGDGSPSSEQSAPASADASSENTASNSGTDYLLDTDKRNIGSEELNGKSELELRFLKAEILARHGAVFEDDDTLKTYFTKKEWYNINPAFSMDDLTDVEAYNYQLIDDYMQKTYATTEATTQAPTQAPTQAAVQAQTAAPAPAPAPAQVSYMYCCASEYATLRSSASTKAGAITTIPYNGTCQYISKVGGSSDESQNFYYVNYAGYNGYVRADMLSSYQNPPYNLAGTTAYIRASDYATFRRGASTSSAEIYKLNYNASCDVIKKIGTSSNDRNNFYYVNHYGDYGYIRADLLSPYLNPTPYYGN